MTIYESFVPPLSHALKSLSKILTKAEAHAAAKKIDPAVLLQSRLYPDMFPLIRQVQIATDHARRGAARLSGQEPAPVADTETSFAELRARIDSTLAILAALTPESFAGAEDRTVSFKAGPIDLSFKGANLVSFWSLPNFYFHMTTAYAILRHNGVEIGKGDFMGG